MSAEEPTQVDDIPVAQSAETARFMAIADASQAMVIVDAWLILHDEPDLYLLYIAWRDSPTPWSDPTLEACQKYAKSRVELIEALSEALRRDACVAPASARLEATCAELAGVLVSALGVSLGVPYMFDQAIRYMYARGHASEAVWAAGFCR